MSIRTTPKPWLLYSYPWMPFPRRVAIYLRERRIDGSLISIVPVSDPQSGNAAPQSFPPRPQGSLPVLVIPTPTRENPEANLLIRQSMAIMEYIEENCEGEIDGFKKGKWSMRGEGMLGRARERELMALAEELTVGWNPVRTFGTGAGTMKLPEAAKEMLEWEYRALDTIEAWFADRDFSYLVERTGEEGTGPTMAEIVLYQFLEFVRDCYEVDLTKAKGEKLNDVYGKEVVRRYMKLGEFLKAFNTRRSVRDEGEVASKEVRKRMQTWWEGVL